MKNVCGVNRMPVSFVGDSVDVLPGIVVGLGGGLMVVVAISSVTKIILDKKFESNVFIHMLGCR